LPFIASPFSTTFPGSSTALPHHLHLCHGRVRVIVRMDLNADRFALPKVHAVDHQRVEQVIESAKL
jgi:hypothetical protein